MNIGQGNSANTTHAVLNNRPFNNSGRPSPKHGTNPVSKNATSNGNNFTNAAAVGHPPR